MPATGSLSGGHLSGAMYLSQNALFGGIVLQFISFIMVSFSFLSYVALACSLVCILTIGYIL